MFRFELFKFPKDGKFKSNLGFENIWQKNENMRKMSYVKNELLIQEVHKSKSQPNACFILLKTWNIQKSKKYLPFKIFIVKCFKP